MPAPCPSCGELVEFDQLGAPQAVIGYGEERKRCPNCDAILVRETSPLPVMVWRLEEPPPES